MPRSLHIQILEYLQQSNAVDAMVDIKPAFESELDTLQKRKELRAELDFLVSEKLIESKGSFDFLGWELVTGLYPLENKTIEVRLSGEWETYLALKQVVVKYDRLPAPILPAGHMEILKSGQENMMVNSLRAGNAAPKLEEVRLNDDVVQADLTPRLSAPGRVVKLQSLADMPPGPVNLKSFKANVIARGGNSSPYFNTENTPFADLEIINLNPAPEKKLSAATILKWLVAVVSFILVVMLYAAYQKHISG